MSDIESETTLTTYYTLLNVEDSASAAEGECLVPSRPLSLTYCNLESADMFSVRKAYLKKAAECHPDKHPDDESATERFQALGGEYSIIRLPIDSPLPG